MNLPALGKKTHDNLYDRSMNNLTLAEKLGSGALWDKEAVVWMSTISRDPEIENGQSTIIWPRSCPDSTIRELSQPSRRILSLILNKCSRWSSLSMKSKEFMNLSKERTSFLTQWKINVISGRYVLWKILFCQILQCYL